MPFYENGDVRIHYEEAGSGFPLLLIAGGGLNSNIGVWTSSGPFDAAAEFKDHFHCITMDQRNAPSGQSTGALEIDRPWDSYADDQLGLMTHLGYQEFLVLGCCIGGPFLWKLMQRAPERIVAAVLCQPSGHRPEMPGLFYNNNIAAWGPALCDQRPEITMGMIDRFLDSMYRSPDDFVFSVTRDFVRSCQTPVLVLPDDIPAHPYAMAMETVSLAPNAEVSMYPWKDTSEHLKDAIGDIRRFLVAHEPATVRN